MFTDCEHGLGEYAAFRKVGGGAELPPKLPADAVWRCNAAHTPVNATFFEGLYIGPGLSCGREPG